jgi:hypothetical protein
MRVRRASSALRARIRCVCRWLAAAAASCVCFAPLRACMRGYVAAWLRAHLRALAPTLRQWNVVDRAGEIALVADEYNKRVVLESADDFQCVVSFAFQTGRCVSRVRSSLPPSLPPSLLFRKTGRHAPKHGKTYRSAVGIRTTSRRTTIIRLRPIIRIVRVSCRSTEHQSS